MEPNSWSRCVRSFWRRSAPGGRRPRRMVGRGLQRRGGRGAQGDHRRLRAEDGKEVELVLHPEQELPDKVVAALEAGEPPDFVFSCWLAPALRSMGLRGSARRSHGRRRPLFGSVRSRCSSTAATLLNATTGRASSVRAADGLRSTHHVHVWKSLLEQAGFTLADIPKEWEAFWSFWCDQVQPAVRQALGRDDVWGIGLPMSVEAADTENAILASSWTAYEADYVTRDGRLVIDDPEVRQQADQGARQLHGDLPQGLHPARFGDLGRSPATTRRSSPRRSS